MSRTALYTVVCILVFMTTAAFAASQYVSDTMEITLRTGPGIDHRITAMLKSGEVVEVLQEGESWTQVRTSAGKVGYALTRFLTSETPSRIALERLRLKHEKLLAQSEAPLKEIARLTDENNNLSKSLKTSQASLKRLNSEYNKLKAESKDYLEIKTKYETVAKELAAQTNKAEKLENEVSRLQLHKNIKWFLSGAGVLFVGFIIGFSTKRQRRRSSLL